MDVYVAKDIFIHVFYGGQSKTFRVGDYSDADIGDQSSPESVLGFVEKRLDLRDGELRNFVVDRNETDVSINLTVRPSEVFG